MKPKIDKSLKFANNPRQITARQFKTLKKHLEQLGDLSGIIYCRNNDAYTGGNMRAEVMHGSKVEIVEEFKRPTKQKTLAYGYVHYEGERFAYREVAFTDEEFKQACIVANSNGGSWDWDVLSGNEWSDLPLSEWGLDVPSDNPDLLALDESAGDKGASLDFIKFRNWSIPVSEEEAAGLEILLNRWLEEKGVLYGFVGGSLLGGNG